MFILAIRFELHTSHPQALVTEEPGIPALPLLLLFHFRLIGVAYVTTVLVRHWAVLYQQMSQNQRNQMHLSAKIERKSYHVISYHIIS